MASVSRRPPAPSQTPLRLACMIGSKAASNDGRPWAWSKDIYSCWWPTPSLRMTTTANMWRSSISFRPEKPIERKDDVMKKKDADTVRFQLDPGNLPPLTEAQKDELDALQAMPDSGIDYSDAPTLKEDFWKTAESGRIYKSTEQRRVGKECVSKCKSRGSPEHKKKKQKNT